ncbi:hypothetical protein GCM10020360_33030 [Nonlabens tegetincola]
MSGDVVYLDEAFPRLPVAVRIGGRILPVASGTPIDVRFADDAVTTVTVTLLVPALEVTAVASEEAAALRSESSSLEGGAK